VLISGEVLLLPDPHSSASIRGRGFSPPLRGEISLPTNLILVHDIHPMQTLNVGAGRTDQEYQATEESRRAELRSDVQTYGMYFFIAAGLAGLGTGLLPIRLFGVVNIGFIDLLTFYGGELIRTNPLLLRAAAALWVGALVGLGFAARKGQRWAFWAGLILYAADMLPLIVMFSIWSFGVHGFFVFQWFKGQRALGELKASASSREGLSRSAVSNQQ
jgi:hypothetical protein